MPFTLPRRAVGTLMAGAAALLAAGFAQADAASDTSSDEKAALQRALAPALDAASRAAALQHWPADAPAYLRAAALSAWSAPLPEAEAPGDAAAKVQPAAAAPPSRLVPYSYYANALGGIGLYLGEGPMNTRRHAFFRAFGTNDRSCFSCHRPSSGMSLSATEVRALYTETNATDPVFAPVDAATCPSQVPRRNRPGAARDKAYQLLLERGVFRVFLPLPARTPDLRPIGGPRPHAREFEIEVVSDPYGCNTDPKYSRVTDPDTGRETTLVSVYRRPRMTANLAAVEKPFFSNDLDPDQTVDPVSGLPVVDPATGKPISGNLTWDGREPTLASLTRSAVLTHAQSATPPTRAQVRQIVAFQRQVYQSQVQLRTAGNLYGGRPRVYGRPDRIASSPVAFGGFTLYNGWRNSPADSDASARDRARASIARGQALFNTRTFGITNVAGFNDATNASTTTTCASCHGNQPAGADPFPAGQRDIGVGGTASPHGGPEASNALPIFKLTCRSGFETIDGRTEVLTNDPGKALITGRCADIGRKTVPQLRALAGREPYFSDGSAATLRAVVDFYDQRFNMGLSSREARDLTAFLSAL